VPGGAALVAALSVLLGCTFSDHVHTVSTDSIALSLGVMTVVSWLWYSRTEFKRAFLVTVVLAVTTIFVRPAYLFLIPWLALAGWFSPWLNASKGEHRISLRQRLRGGWMAGVIALVVLCWMGSRLVVVGEFGLLPFGHQNLSGILVQTVTQDELLELAESASDSHPEAAQLAGAVALQLQWMDFETPSDSSGLPTMTMESQWDDLNYRVVWPTAKKLIEGKENDSSRTPAAIDEHRMIGGLNRMIVARYPQRYLRWLALAARRAVWGTAADILMHPVFLLTFVVGLLWWLVKLVAAPARYRLAMGAGWRAFCWIGMTYWIAKVGFVILSSPPLGRFADAAAVFLPAIVIGTLLQIEREPQAQP
ncbi:MAG: hypothetical protein AAFV88_20730, partial [Planctomycetota bacterium]